MSPQTKFFTFTDAVLLADRYCRRPGLDEAVKHMNLKLPGQLPRSSSDNVLTAYALLASLEGHLDNGAFANATMAQCPSRLASLRRFDKEEFFASLPVVPQYSRQQAEEFSKADKIRKA